MRFLSQALIAAFAVAIAVSGSSLADPAFSTTHSISNEKARDNSKSNDANKIDCARFRNDPRCRPPQRPHHPDTHPPVYYPQPYRRPVIINQLPEQPAIEINSLTDDWEGCRKAKLGAIRARKSGHSDEANNLDEWLWKNCRSYSYELRELEQDDM